MGVDLGVSLADFLALFVVGVFVAGVPALGAAGVLKSVNGASS